MFTQRFLDCLWDENVLLDIDLFREELAKRSDPIGDSLQHMVADLWRLRFAYDVLIVDATPRTEGHAGEVQRSG
jgi:hypothetical protein